MNAEESIPVVIRNGEGQELQTRIYRGVMDPVGMRPQQVVTATLLLPSSWAGQQVRLGLYDGGIVAASAVEKIIDPPVLPGDIGGLVTLSVSANGTAEFNFQAGPTLGLYRLMVTVGPGQYLLQFYVKPAIGN